MRAVFVTSRRKVQPLSIGAPLRDELYLGTVLVLASLAGPSFQTRKDTPDWAIGKFWDKRRSSISPILVRESRCVVVMVGRFTLVMLCVLDRGR
jgi:hypothetical protein